MTIDAPTQDDRDRVASQEVLAALEAAWPGDDSQQLRLLLGVVLTLLERFRAESVEGAAFAAAFYVKTMMRVVAGLDPIPIPISDEEEGGEG
jgi:hypothetical protein